MKSILSEPHFHNEEAAFAYVEARLWPAGPVCPHCGGMNRIGKLKGKTTRPGLYKCYGCRKPFTVRMGTVFESSHAPMRIWLQAIYMMCSGKKGISTQQLHRTFGGSMKTAWFLGHRIREAMSEGPYRHGGPKLGGLGLTIEADETYVGGKAAISASYQNTGVSNFLLDSTTICGLHSLVDSGARGDVTSRVGQSGQRN